MTQGDRVTEAVPEPRPTNKARKGRPQVAAQPGPAAGPGPRARFPRRTDLLDSTG